MNENNTEHPIEETPLEGESDDALSELHNRWLRALADTENLRKRSAKEREEASKFATTAFARDVLSMIDNLGRALDVYRESPEKTVDMLARMVEGVEMTLSESFQILSRHGVERIESLRETFDPHRHQAVFEVETDEHPAGTILQVLRDGYVLHDRLLRPAMVAVAKEAVNKNPEMPKIHPGM